MPSFRKNILTSIELDADAAYFIGPSQAVDVVVHHLQSVANNPCPDIFLSVFRDKKYAQISESAGLEWTRQNSWFHYKGFLIKFLYQF